MFWTSQVSAFTQQTTPVSSIFFSTFAILGIHSLSSNTMKRHFGVPTTLSNSVQVPALQADKSPDKAPPKRFPLFPTLSRVLFFPAVEKSLPPLVPLDSTTGSTSKGSRPTT